MMYQDQRHALIVAAGLAAAYLGDDETVLKTIIGMVQEADPGEETNGGPFHRRVAHALSIESESENEVLKEVAKLVREHQALRESIARLNAPVTSSDEELAALANLRADLKSALRLADDTDLSDVDLVKAVGHQYEALVSFRLSVPHVEGLKAERAIRKLRDSGFVYSDLHGWTAPPPPVPTASGLL